MKKDKYKTKVVFRILEGEVIALFPNNFGSPGYIMSYQHVGQHGDAEPELITELPKARKSQYADLKKELELLGYNLDVLHSSSKKRK